MQRQSLPFQFLARFKIGNAEPAFSIFAIPKKQCKDAAFSIIIQKIGNAEPAFSIFKLGFSDMKLRNAELLAPG